ncbi:MAG: thiamine-phosphate kinase [Candidatus Eremiobacteraeota bacterium]|nr:thiamine-phosphate kinase [Candidatus Eremiobacteraeota bacterium]
MITTDALVEDVHFTRDAMSAAQVGERALASNLSDIAAMGARPILATIALGVPRGLPPQWILDCYAGIAELARHTGTAIAGGDIVGAPSIVISISIVGEVRPSNLKLRSGARPGDVLAVTGELGGSRVGLEIMLERSDLRGDPRFASALAAYTTPQPRLREGHRLGASVTVHAMMDLSDGLSTDLHRLCAASNVGAVIDEVPCAPCVREFAALAGTDPLRYALDGGEDFELLVAIAPRAFRTLAARFEKTFGRRLSRIGSVTEGSAVRLRNGDGTRELTSAGWDHLRAR